MGWQALPFACWWCEEGFGEGRVDGRAHRRCRRRAETVMLKRELSDERRQAAVSLVEFGCGDAQRSSGVRPGRSDDDVDIAAEGHQEAQ